MAREKERNLGWNLCTQCSTQENRKMKTNRCYSWNLLKDNPGASSTTNELLLLYILLEFTNRR